MSRKLLQTITGIAGLIFLILSFVILSIDLAQYNRQTLVYPQGSMIQNIPIGGLNRSKAFERLNAIFTTPIELQYGSTRMQFSPLELGFTPNIDKSLDILESNIQKSGYWSHLWNINPQTIDRDSLGD